MDTEQLFKNAILKRLPNAELQAFLAKATKVQMNLHDVAIESEQTIEIVHFPEEGMHSMVAIIDHEEVETATIGWEGMIGIPLALGETKAQGRVFCQISGYCWQVKAADFLQFMAELPVFAKLCLRYCWFVFEQAAQNSACNRWHSIEERCAKWLLMSHDRSHGDAFDLTQEFLAQMLGVRRQSVNLAAGALSAAGFIKYSRGNIVVLNRPGLESVTCECYSKIKLALDIFLAETMQHQLDAR